MKRTSTWKSLARKTKKTIHLPLTFQVNMSKIMKRKKRRKVTKVIHKMQSSRIRALAKKVEVAPKMRNHLLSKTTRTMMMSTTTKKMTTMPNSSNQNNFNKTKPDEFVHLTDSFKRSSLLLIIDSKPV